MQENNDIIKTPLSIDDNENLAVKFPDWDLLPPDLLIKRGKNENTN